jgi:RNA polymerase sigma-70 factor (ECF subfamily)
MRPYSVAVAVRTTSGGVPLRLVRGAGSGATARGPSAAEEEPPVSAVEHARAPSDGELLQQARVGQSAAFEQLYRRHAPRALALAVRVQGSRIDVEDIVHDAFLRAHARLGTLRDGDAFGGWLASIVVSLVRTRLRRRKLLARLGLVPGEPVELDALVARDAGPEVRAQVAEVYAALTRLPVDQRVAWALRYVEGRRLEEVSGLLGCSLATAKRWIGSAQRALLAGDAPAEEALP